MYLSLTCREEVDIARERRQDTCACSGNLSSYTGQWRGKQKREWRFVALSLSPSLFPPSFVCVFVCVFGPCAKGHMEKCCDTFPRES